MTIKRIGLLIILAVLMLLPAYADSNINVVYNGCPLEIKPNPTVVNGRTLIPLRSIMESFGAQVEWMPEDNSILISRSKTTIRLQVNNNVAEINGVESQLDAAPQLIDSKTYVPLRFVSEALDLMVNWDGSSKTVYLSDGPENTSGPLHINSSVSELLTLFKEPQRIDKSRYGFDWYIYNTSPSDYRQVGVKEGKVLALYGFNVADLTDSLLKPGMSRLEVQQAMGSCISSIKKGNTVYSLIDTHQDTYKRGNVYYTCFYDSSPDQLLYAVSLIDSATEEDFKGYCGTPSEALAKSYEREIFDITNAYRAFKNLSPLTASTALDGSARQYSTDMGLQHFFAHVSPTGQTFKDRLLTVIKKYTAAGENLAAGASDAIQAMNCWINSPGHLANLVGDYDTLGTGVYLGSNSQSYYTQHFVKNGVVQ